MRDLLMKMTSWGYINERRYMGNEAWGKGYTIHVMTEAMIRGEMESQFKKSKLHGSYTFEHIYIFQFLINTRSIVLAKGMRADPTD